MVRPLLLSFSYYIVFSSAFAEEIVKECHVAFKQGPDGESCYRAVFDTMTWQEAQKTCKAFKSNLTSVSSEAEMEFIWDSVIDVVYYHYWIGLYKNSSENGWQWVDGTKFDTSWTIWRTGQPTDDDKYALLYLNSAGIDPYWSGNTNGNNRHVFICKHRIASSHKSTVPDTSTQRLEPTTQTTYLPRDQTTAGNADSSEVTEPSSDFVTTSDLLESTTINPSAMYPEPSPGPSENGTTEANGASFLEVKEPSKEASEEAIEAPVAVAEATQTGGAVDVTGTHQISCPNKFVVGPDDKNCYRVLHYENDWRLAQNACHEIRANLTSITSDKEMNFILKNIKNATDYWIGLYKNSKSGWQWIDGATFDTNWAKWTTGQPNPQDKYGILNYEDQQPHWLGNGNGTRRSAFICKCSTLKTSRSANIP